MQNGRFCWVFLVLLVLVRRDSSSSRLPFSLCAIGDGLLLIFCVINLLNYVDRGAIASNGVNGSRRTCTKSGTCSSGSGIQIDGKVLNVGEELWRETLPLQMGSRLYELRGLKSYTLYEVKISYPASIPASFSLELRRDKSDLALHTNRRLLNTEKIIFKTDALDSDQEGMYVLVSVEPEGFVAIPNVSEREFILFNIVCNELLLGIPHKAWWVMVLVILCLGLAFFIPSFLPPYLLQKNPSPRSLDRSASKHS